MIAHISTTPSFQRTAHYLKNGHGMPAPDRVLWVESYGGASPDLMTAASEMEDLAQYNGRIKIPGYHLILSFDPADDVGREDMLYVRDQIHDALALPDLMSTVVAHGDAYYPHWHELICRVDYWTGKAVDPSFPYYKIEQRLREVERELGLRETPGRHGRLLGQTFLRKDSGDWLSAEDKRYVRAALRTSVSWRELEARLTKRGLGLRIDRSNLTIVRGANRIRAGTLQRGASLRKMEDRMGQSFADYARSQRRDVLDPTWSVHGERLAERDADSGSLFGQRPERSRPLYEDEGSTETRAVSTPSEESGGVARVERPGTAENHAVSAVIVTLLDRLRALADVDADARRAAEAIREASRRESWEIHLHDLRERTVDARGTFETLLAQVYRHPKRASAAYQLLSAVEGLEAATERLQTQPGWFGTPTELGHSAEGDLVLQEAAARGADYRSLLDAARDLHKRLVEEGLIDDSHASGRPAERSRPRATAVNEQNRLAEVVGAERAEEVMATLGQDPGPETPWTSSELPAVLVRRLTRQGETLSQKPGPEKRQIARDLEADILRRVEALSEPQRLRIAEAVRQDPHLVASGRVAHVVRQGTSRAPFGMTR